MNGQLTRALMNAPLLNGVSGAHIEAITRMSRPECYDENAVIFEAGEPCGAFYFVVEGLIKLYVTTNRDHLKIIEFVSPGDTFAEAAMFSGQGYPVSALAMVDSLLVRIDAFGFTRYVHQHPDLAWNMLAQLSRRSHYLIAQIRQMSLHSAKSKVADFLLQRYAPEEPQTPLPSLPTRRADLAAAVGLTVETLCRVLSDFRNHGWISTRDSAIVVNAPEKLERYQAGGKATDAKPSNGDAGSEAVATVV